ncbi:UPF0187-domain-containing protein [Punctularia strigosozonata HHB-11173 SS5]|uniref:UPF0187-domain-containing protein n=1 Tax=Punctularia strigosozonata (strain HHB-11173) TaxID=741275 RepID=UPI00044178CC|nr:UPF0187-domain-containing protein [Punctularia strigosozonata HHB-11173 SS5]EIN05575.1 UPF0187-domain-containing protein [Punctularia strigosozonata HHB-11173 SS5]
MVVPGEHPRAQPLGTAPSTGSHVHFVNGIGGVGRGRHFEKQSFTNVVLASSILRCWHTVFFFTIWATVICFINRAHTVAIQSTLLTVLGTILGFVVSLRTTSSFERYNEGRRLWGEIVLGTRTFARVIWFHVPDTTDGADKSPEETNARSLIEKKTVLNLLEGFAVAVKHYLRGEVGIHYVDLYHLVKHLPSYALPAGVPSATNEDILSPLPEKISESNGGPNQHGTSGPRSRASSTSSLPMPATTPRASHPGGKARKPSVSAPQMPQRRATSRFSTSSFGPGEEGILLPARMPPKYGLSDVFPFSRLGKDVGGKKAARLRAKWRDRAGSHNIPLEISFYLSSYIAALQQRKCLDAPVTTTLQASVTQLVSALTGLERILTTPIPFSYSVHLWVVNFIYCLVLPFQIVGSLGWVTIPGAAIVSFFFFGFILAGEEIEGMPGDRDLMLARGLMLSAPDPFGYHKNDLNMDHFTRNIIRNELRAITATPAPQVSSWAFAPANDRVFEAEDRVTPEEWVRRGTARMQLALSL